MCELKTRIPWEHSILQEYPGRTRLHTFVLFGNTIAYICRWVTNTWIRKINKHDRVWKLYATLPNLLISLIIIKIFRDQQKKNQKKSTKKKKT
jgi:hypothetical protein